MTTVTSATSAASAADSSSSSKTTSISKSQTIDYNQFLTLFMAELKNQDPMDPSDPTAFVSQLASFSGVEQSVKTNSKLDALMALSALSQADSLIGHTATSADGKITGIVASVAATSNGAKLTLKDGSEVMLGEGVKIS
jgi:flagellar basal-body rod modification protein FlgD